MTYLRLISILHDIIDREIVNAFDEIDFNLLAEEIRKDAEENAEIRKEVNNND